MRDWTWRQILLVVLAGATSAVGCAAVGPPTPRRDVRPSWPVEPTGNPDGNHEVCADGIDNDVNGAVDCADPACLGDIACPSPVDSCVSATLSASVTPAPVDIVWVVDTSDSMQNERDEVGRRLGDFATGIASAGLDPHVVLITLPDRITIPGEFSSDRDHFLLVPSAVGSSKPLERLLSNLNAGFAPIPHDGYASFLRASAATHLVAVTDDDSELSAASFDSQMRGELARIRGTGDGSYVFHAVASEDTGGHDPCSGAAEVGDQYLSLVASTGGEFQSICSGDWAALFDRVSVNITESALLPCSVPIPTPAEGTALDYGAVNLWFTPSTSGIGTLIPGASSASTCPPLGGWYYDDPEAPTTLELCPATCDSVQGDPAGRLDVALGCATVVR